MKIRTTIDIKPLLALLRCVRHGPACRFVHKPVREGAAKALREAVIEAIQGQNVELSPAEAQLIGLNPADVSKLQGGAIILDESQPEPQKELAL